MTQPRCVRANGYALALGLALAAPGTLLAQATQVPVPAQAQVPLQAPAAAASEYQPVSGQAGKDVVWVPSPVETVEKMLDMAKLTSADFVVDLGSGDGRNIILSAKRGARGLGVEYNPELVELSRRNAAREGVAHLAQFVQGDMYEADFSKATVLALFLLPDNLRKLEPKFRKLAPGSRIVANTFGIEGWTPDREESITGPCSAWCRVILYTVPVTVDGIWRSGKERMQISQNVQVITGVRTRARESQPIEGRVEGERVRFSVGAAKYAGIVKGKRIEGTVEEKGRKRPWAATRAG